MAVFWAVSWFPDKYRCISSNRDRLGLYEDIRIVIGTVCIVILRGKGGGLSSAVTTSESLKQKAIEKTGGAGKNEELCRGIS